MPKRLCGDQIRLKQVIINLTKNALKFTFNGEIKIRATYDAASELLRVSVTDSGKGIDPVEQAKLFKAFGKLPQAGNLNQEGVGMGLAICKRIILNSGGSISVFSEGEDKGSTFVFSMKMKLLDLDLQIIEEQRMPYQV